MGSLWSYAWKWLLVAALCSTPALVGGQSVGIAVGLHYELPLAPILVVSVVFGYLEGLAFMKLALWGETRPRVARWLEKWRTERTMRIAEKYGRWLGFLFGPAIGGQEPMIFALIWLRVPPRKLLLPLLMTNVVYTGVYFWIGKAGLAQFDTLRALWEDMKLFKEMLWS